MVGIDERGNVNIACQAKRILRSGGAYPNVAVCSVNEEKWRGRTKNEKPIPVRRTGTDGERTSEGGCGRSRGGGEVGRRDGGAGAHDARRDGARDGKVASDGRGGECCGARRERSARESAKGAGGGRNGAGVRNAPFVEGSATEVAVTDDEVREVLNHVDLLDGGDTGRGLVCHWLNESEHPVREVALERGEGLIQEVGRDTYLCRRALDHGRGVIGRGRIDDGWCGRISRTHRRGRRSRGVLRRGGRGEDDSGRREKERGKRTTCGIKKIVDCSVGEESCAFTSGQGRRGHCGE